MKLNDLLEESNNVIKHRIVTFSELTAMDNWDSKFWIGMDKFIEEYKAKGKEKAIKEVALAVKKIGETNYNALKNESDKNSFGVPYFDVASDYRKLSAKKYAPQKIVILMDLLKDKKEIRKAKLEAELEKLKKELAKLGD